MNTISNNFLCLCLCILFFNQSILAQSKLPNNSNKSEHIIYTSNDTLYSDKSNIVAIVVEKSLRANIEVESTQGRLYKRDNQLFLIDSLHNGNVTISVFKRINSKKVLLEKRKIIVSKSPVQTAFDQLRIDPGINMSGYFGGRIPLDLIKDAKELSIKPEYKIISCVLYVSAKKSEYSEPVVRYLDSGTFDNDILKLFKLLKQGVIVAFDEIKFVDNNGKLVVYPKLIAFNVIEN